MDNPKDSEIMKHPFIAHNIKESIESQFPVFALQSGEKVTHYKADPIKSQTLLSLTTIREKTRAGPSAMETGKFIEWLIASANNELQDLNERKRKTFMAQQHFEKMRKAIDKTEKTLLGLLSSTKTLSKNLLCKFMGPAVTPSEAVPPKETKKGGKKTEEETRKGSLIKESDGSSATKEEIQNLLVHWADFDIQKNMRNLSLNARKEISSLKMVIQNQMIALETLLKPEKEESGKKKTSNDSPITKGKIKEKPQSLKELKMPNALCQGTRGIIKDFLEKEEGSFVCSFLSLDGAVLRSNLEDFESRKSLRLSVSAGTKQEFNTLAPFRGGNMFLFVDRCGKQLSLYDGNLETTIKTWRTDSEVNRAVPVNEVLIGVGTQNGNLLFYDPDQERPIRTIELGPAGVTDIVLSPDSQTMFIGDTEGNVLSLEIGTGEIQWSRHLVPGSNEVSCLAISPDGSILAVAGGNMNKKVAFFDARTGEASPIEEFSKFSGTILTQKWSDDSSFLMVQSEFEVVLLAFEKGQNNKGVCVEQCTLNKSLFGGAWLQSLEVDWERGKAYIGTIFGEVWRVSFE